MRKLPGVFLGLASAALVAAALAKQPPPVIRHLGSYHPKPAPSPEQADRIRLVTSFTLRNRPEGESIVSFEVTDLARSQLKETTKYRVIATDNYSLAEPKKNVIELHDEILLKVRDLERALIDYAERSGPPRERQTVHEQPPAH